MKYIANRSNPINAGHYENFPVASIILPGHLRRPVRLLYAFARGADDLADEGESTPATRLAALAGLRAKLRALERGEAVDDPLYTALGQVIRDYRLPYAPFHDLLDAFCQDVSKNRYADFGEVMQYCRKSANPIGRLLLALYGDSDPRHLAWSDGICSALQLINFLQDVAIDYRKGRLYLPLDEMAGFGLSERQIAEGRVDALWQQFMKAQIERAQRILAAGSPLGRALKGRLGLEMRLIILGGQRILEKLRASQGDIFHHRPRLGPIDGLIILRRALFTGQSRPAASPCAGGGCSKGCQR